MVKFSAEDIVMETNSVSQMLPTQRSNKYKTGLRHSVISKLLTSEGSGGEPDQSQLESMVENTPQAFHMHISLGEEKISGTGNTLGDFYGNIFALSL